MRKQSYCLRDNTCPSASEFLETDDSLVGKHVAHREWRGKASISVKAPEGFGLVVIIDD